MFGFFKKKLPPPPPSPAPIPEKKFKKVLKFKEKTSIDVGLSEIVLTFEDRRTFSTWIQGSVHQYIQPKGYGYREVEPIAGDLSIIKSKDAASQWLTTGHLRDDVFYDCYPNTSEAIVGKVIGAKITGEVLPFEVDFREAYIDLQEVTEK